MHEQTDAERATLKQAMTALDDVGASDPGFDMAVVDSKALSGVIYRRRGSELPAALSDSYRDAGRSARINVTFESAVTTAGEWLRLNQYLRSNRAQRQLDDVGIKVWSADHVPGGAIEITYTSRLENDDTLARLATAFSSFEPSSLSFHVGAVKSFSSG